MPEGMWQRLGVSGQYRAEVLGWTAPNTSGFLHRRFQRPPLRVCHRQRQERMSSCACQACANKTLSAYRTEACGGGMKPPPMQRKALQRDNRWSLCGCHGRLDRCAIAGVMPTRARRWLTIRITVPFVREDVGAMAKPVMKIGSGRDKRVEKGDSLRAWHAPHSS